MEYGTVRMGQTNPQNAVSYIVRYLGNQSCDVIHPGMYHGLEWALTHSAEVNMSFVYRLPWLFPPLADFQPRVRGNFEEELFLI